MQVCTIARVIDGSDFDRVIWERAFLDSRKASAALADAYADAVAETEEHIFKMSIRTQTERHFIEE